MRGRAGAAGSVEQLIARVVGRPATVEPGGAHLAIVRLDDYPAPGQTTLVTSGLAAHRRSMYRGLPVAFELVLTSQRAHVEALGALLAAAALDDLDAAEKKIAYLRVQSLPPRGVMHNGAYQAEREPHLVFSTELAAIPSLAGRHRVGAGYVELLPAIPITAKELEEYDRSPRALIRRLRQIGSLDDYADRT
jgi:hypothetical protein